MEFFFNVKSNENEFLDPLKKEIEKDKLMLGGSSFLSLGAITEMALSPIYEIGTCLVSDQKDFSVYKI